MNINIILMSFVITWVSFRFFSFRVFQFLRVLKIDKVSLHHHPPPSCSTEVSDDKILITSLETGQKEVFIPFSFGDKKFSAAVYNLKYKMFYLFLLCFSCDLCTHPFTLPLISSTLHSTNFYNFHSFLFLFFSFFLFVFFSFFLFFTYISHIYSQVRSMIVLHKSKRRVNHLFKILIFFYIPFI